MELFSFYLKKLTYTIHLSLKKAVLTIKKCEIIPAECSKTILTKQFGSINIRQK
jgi:hypothetical protein